MKIEQIGSETIYFGLTREEKEQIKEDLTFDNPKYADAKKYSKSNYITVPKYLYYYTEKKRGKNGEKIGTITTPSGYRPSKELQKELWRDDKRTFLEEDYPKFKLELREDQEKAKQAYLKTQEDPYPKSLVQLPTGKGKSILAINLAHTLQQRTLILVHKDDLVIGWNKDIELCLGKIDVGLIKAKSRTVGNLITIATVQTLDRMSEEDLALYTSKFGLVIVDECHRVGSNMFNIVGKFSSRYKLGLSATPTRADGMDYAFDLFLGGLCYKHKYEIGDEDIKQCRVIKRMPDVKYTPFVYDGRVLNTHDYNHDELPKNIVYLEDIPFKERPRVPYAEVDKLVTLNRKYKFMVGKDVLNHYNQGHSCLLMFKFKDEIKAYYEYLTRYIPKERIVLFYGDSKETSQSVMEKAESKECLITLATLAKASEGTNVNAWEVEFLVSSMSLAKEIEQATGRIRRQKKGKLETSLIYDYRCPDVKTFNKHVRERDKTYKKLLYEVEKDHVKKKSTKQRSMFNRGYK